MMSSTTSEHAERPPSTTDGAYLRPCSIGIVLTADDQFIH